MTTYTVVAHYFANTFGVTDILIVSSAQRGWHGSC